jgi:hypothetical protein
LDFPPNAYNIHQPPSNGHPSPFLQDFPYAFPRIGSNASSWDSKPHGNKNYQKTKFTMTVEDTENLLSDTEDIESVVASIISSHLAQGNLAVACPELHELPPQQYAVPGQPAAGGVTVEPPELHAIPPQSDAVPGQPAAGALAVDPPEPHAIPPQPDAVP